MGIHITLRKMMTLGLLTIGAAGLALADQNTAVPLNDGGDNQ